MRWTEAGIFCEDSEWQETMGKKNHDHCITPEQAREKMKGGSHWVIYDWELYQSSDSSNVSCQGSLLMSNKQTIPQTAVTRQYYQCVSLDHNNQCHLPAGHNIQSRNILLGFKWLICNMRVPHPTCQASANNLLLIRTQTTMLSLGSIQHCSPKQFLHRGVKLPSLAFKCT